MASGLPENFTVRPPRPDEIEAVFEFSRDCELTEDGVSDTVLEDLQRKWNSEKFNLATDAVLALDPTGKIAGYAITSNEDGIGWVGMKPVVRFTRMEKVVRPGMPIGVEELAE